MTTLYALSIFINIVLIGTTTLVYFDNGSYGYNKGDPFRFKFLMSIWSVLSLVPILSTVLAVIGAWYLFLRK